MGLEFDFEEFKKIHEKLKRNKIEIKKALEPINLEEFENNELEEICHVGKFVAKFKGEVKIIDKTLPPNPDFVLQYKNKKIGLEHTRIINDGAQRYYSVKSLLEIAQEVYIQKYNTNVLATFSILNDSWDYSKVEQKYIAEEIADLVHQKINNNSINLPEKITKINISKHSLVSFSYKEKNWEPEILSRERLKKDIQKKERKIDLYKSSKDNLNEIWLVLFIGTLNSATYNIDHSESYKINSKFDRVYLMDDFKNCLYRIN